MSAGFRPYSWEALYERELANHQESGDDEGTVWFQESAVESAVIRELDRLADTGHLVREPSAHDPRRRPASRFLDLGTGNGHMLFALLYPDDDDDNEDGDTVDVDQAWAGDMVGVDYSATSTALANRIAARRQAQGKPQDLLDRIRFKTWDLLTQPPGSWLGDGFDVVLDKGTFDAISLMPATPAFHSPCDTFRNNVTPLIRKGGLLFVTSCNWTKEELVEWLAPPGGSLRLFSELKYQTFTFGGKTGQTVVTLVFQRGESEEG